MKYTLYHIKGVKWGMALTKRLKRRLKEAGYTLDDCCEFEYYDDEDIGADREKELNLKFDYPWQDSQDYRRVSKMAKHPNTTKRRLESGAGFKKGMSHLGYNKNQPYGEIHHKSKLTEKDVLEIRSKHIPYKYTSEHLAKEYNVSKKTIDKVVYRTSWKHI